MSTIRNSFLFVMLFSIVALEQACFLWAPTFEPFFYQYADSIRHLSSTSPYFGETVATIDSLEARDSQGWFRAYLVMMGEPSIAGERHSTGDEEYRILLLRGDNTGKCVHVNAQGEKWWAVVKELLPPDLRNVYFQITEHVGALSASQILDLKYAITNAGLVQRTTSRDTLVRWGGWIMEYRKQGRYYFVSASDSDVALARTLLRLFE